MLRYIIILFKDATFNVILLIQIIINSNLLDLMKSKLVYFFSVWILLLIRFNDFKKWETYVTALILVNLVLLQNVNTFLIFYRRSNNTWIDLNRRCFVKRRNFCRLLEFYLNLYKSHCVLYIKIQKVLKFNMKGNQIKVLLQTGSFQNEYMKFENL